MRDIKNIVFRITLILIAISTLINFLFCHGVLVWDFVYVGYILIMLGSIALNYVSIKERKEELNPLRKTTLITFLIIVICVAWIVSFCMTFSYR